MMHGQTELLALVKEEKDVYDLIFRELTAQVQSDRCADAVTRTVSYRDALLLQVSTQCRPRGQLLASVRHHYSSLFSR